MNKQDFSKKLLTNTKYKISQHCGECVSYHCPLEITFSQLGLENLFEKDRNEMINEIGREFFLEKYDYSLCYVVSLYLFIKIFGMPYEKAIGFLYIDDTGDDPQGLEMCVLDDTYFFENYFPYLRNRNICKV